MITIGDSIFNPSEEAPIIKDNNSSEEDLQGETIESASVSVPRKLRCISTSRVAPTNRSPPRKTKLLSDLYNSCTFALHVADPQEYKEAVKQKEWKDTMDAELSSIRSNNTWELTELPYGKKAVGLKWVYKTKYKADGEIQKHKARLVAKGYSQQFGLDYD